jgi:hypothetical protein
MVYKASDYFWKASCRSGETPPFTVIRLGTDNIFSVNDREEDHKYVSWEIVSTESGYVFNLYQFSSGRKLTPSPTPLTNNSRATVVINNTAVMEIQVGTISKQYPYHTNNVISNSNVYYKHRNIVNTNDLLYFSPSYPSSEYCVPMPNSNYEHPAINYADEPVVSMAPFSLAQTTVKYIVNLCRRGMGGLRQMVRRWYS